MVLLTTTPAVKVALEAYLNIENIEESATAAASLSKLQVGEPIEHQLLVKVSKTLLSISKDTPDISASRWHLDALLRGTSVHRPSPPAKPEPSPEYTALMQRLRRNEEQRLYERMITAPSTKNILSARAPVTSAGFDPMLSHGQIDQGTVDELTLKDINSQLTLILNVLVSIIASGVTIWFAARYWALPQRLALSMTGSIVIAVAEVVLYMSYIRKTTEAKTLERKKIEHREIADTWVIETTTSRAGSKEASIIRHRKGKHR